MPYQGQQSQSGNKVEPCRWGSACKEQGDASHCAKFSHPKAATATSSSSSATQGYSTASSAKILCKWGSECTRGAACKFLHPEFQTSNVRLGNGLASTASKIECKWGDACRDKGDAAHCAKFSHPADADQVGKKPCRFGVACRNQGDADHCAKFSHPEGKQPCKFGHRCRDKDDPTHCARYSHPSTLRYSNSRSLGSAAAAGSSNSTSSASRPEEETTEDPSLCTTQGWKPQRMQEYSKAPTAEEAKTNIQASAASGVLEQHEYEQDQYNTYVQNTTASGSKEQAGSCMQLHHGPGAPGTCDMRCSHVAGAHPHGWHFWLCHHCSTVQYWGACVNSCDWGTYGWTCIEPMCKASECGCEKGQDYWRAHGRDWLVKK